MRGLKHRERLVKLDISLYMFKEHVNFKDITLVLTN